MCWPVAAAYRTTGVRSILPRVKEARHVAGYIVWVKFNDGAEGEVDLSSELHGEVFEPLKAIERFKAFRIHPELHTLVWPSGADLAPEFLRSALRVTALNLPPDRR